MKLLYLSISSILYVLSFSPFDYKVFIFFSLAFLFHSLENLSIKNKIKAVIYFSLLCHLLGTSWINYSLINYGSLGHLLSYTITFLFALIISLPYVLIGLYKSISSNNYFYLCYIASLFVLAEYLKSILYGGFSWLLIGHSQNGTIFDSVYPILGSFAVSYLVVLTSLFFYKAFNDRNKVSLFFSSVLLVVYFLNPILHSNENTRDLDTVSYTLYQPNIYPQQSYDSAQYSLIMKKYNTIINMNKTSDLVIFPETIISIPFTREDEFFKSFQTTTDDTNMLITGLFSKSDDKFFNSMIFFSDSIKIYNKRKLVPFGEYTPWYNSLLKLAENLNIPLSNLSSGPERIEKISFGNINIIPMICFESTFPNLIESSSDQEIIVNISNDAWFGESLAPHQHLQITQIRALEFNRYILRVTNTGISAVIKNDGQIVDLIENNVEGTLKGQIPTKIKSSFYSEYGDILILMLIFFSLLINGLNRATKHYEQRL
ncbi:MAG: apolipoprotein N-acyltransferase [Ectothiorhodospiraceae bacterium]|nr:MAG: apolipoprotein N-acyltransferase [Ectothiorhodospiraceae bacterium]